MLGIGELRIARIKTERKDHGHRDTFCQNDARQILSGGDD